jgi:methyl-accepting chemotaxis protein
MQHQEERRAVIENAISAFRERAENLLRTVADSAGEMRATAASLFNASGHTSQRAESAVQTSNEASTNVETAAIAADELSSSIAEIGRRLNQTTEVVRVAVDEAQVTNQDIGALAQGGAEDRRCHQAHPEYCRTNQSAGAQCHHRGGARRRSKARFRGGRCRGEVARRADREGDRGYQCR